jgi:hypothetical protein
MIYISMNLFMSKLAILAKSQEKNRPNEFIEKALVLPSTIS